MYNAQCNDDGLHEIFSWKQTSSLFAVAVVICVFITIYFLYTHTTPLTHSTHISFLSVFISSCEITHILCLKGWNEWVFQNHDNNYQCFCFSSLLCLLSLYVHTNTQGLEDAGENHTLHYTQWFYVDRINSHHQSEKHPDDDVDASRSGSSYERISLFWFEKGL